MARGLNKVMLIGRLGEDPKMRYTPSGTAVAAFSVATSEGWKDRQTGEQKERVEWHHCEAWGRLAEVCSQYLGKGSQVYIDGSIRTEEWKDKTTGEDRKAIKIRVSEMHMLDSKPAGQPTTPVPEPIPQQSFDESIPF